MSQELAAALPAGELASAGHATHVSMLVAPVAGEKVPLMQSMQAAEPAADLYVPGPQAEHKPPSGPVNPGLHRHAFDDSLPICEIAFG